MVSHGNSSSERTQTTNAMVHEGQSLPESYGATEAALLPRDPNWMFVYWDITEEKKRNMRRDYGESIFEKSQPLIRVHDVTGIADFNGSNSCRYFDIPVMLDARSWYINVQEGGKSYCCEIGLMLPDGRFVRIVMTNIVHLPAGKVSDVTDEKWMAVSGDFDKLLQLSGVEYIGKGSGEVAKSLAQRWEMLKSVFSRAASWGVSSLQQHRKHEQARKFWLVADCEVILYGATEPDAHVTVAGRKVNLNPDGTFSMRFALHDGLLALPVQAQSKDGVDSRHIGIDITRKTKNDGV